MRSEEREFFRDHWPHMRAVDFKAAFDARFDTGLGLANIASKAQQLMLQKYIPEGFVKGLDLSKELRYSQETVMRHADRNGITKHRINTTIYFDREGADKLRMLFYPPPPWPAVKISDAERALGYQKNSLYLHYTIYKYPQHKQGRKVLIPLGVVQIAAKYPIEEKRPWAQIVQEWKDQNGIED